MADPFHDAGRSGIRWTTKENFSLRVRDSTVFWEVSYTPIDTILCLIYPERINLAGGTANGNVISVGSALPTGAAARFPPAGGQGCRCQP